MTFALAANVGRHVQKSHPIESRLVGLSSPAALLVFGTFGVSDSAAPDLLPPAPAPVELGVLSLPPQFSINELLEEAAHEAAGELADADDLNQLSRLVDDTDSDVEWGVSTDEDQGRRGHADAGGQG